MLPRLIRVLLLTFCFLLLVSVSLPPAVVHAGDPDEVVESPAPPGPDGSEPPDWEPDRGGSGVGDPDEVIEGFGGSGPSTLLFFPDFRWMFEAMWVTWSAL